MFNTKTIMIMQKKNFLSSLIAAMLLLSGTSIMVSCDDIVDNPTPVIQPPVKQVVETVANVTGANPSDVTAALEAIVTNKAIKEAAAKGEPIKITVAGSGVSTDATDQTITIPQKNGANIEIAFETVPTGTDSNSLVIEASEGTGNLPSAARNNLTVTMPPSEGLAIVIELPKTTVTLKTDGNGEVIYQDVIAKTAKSTIIIDKGVTIKEHELVGGNIVVNNGGAIETLAVTVKDSVGIICLGSWWSGVSFMGAEPDYEIKNEDGSYYMPKNLRVKKGDGDYVHAWTCGPDFEYIEKLIIGEGVTLALGINSHFKAIVGEGDNKAKINLRGWIHPTFSDWENPIEENVNGYYYVFDFDPNTEKVSNVTLTEERGETNPENIPFVDQQTAPFTSTEFNIKFDAKADGETTFTFENCEFPENSSFNLDFVNYKRDANGNIVYGDVTLYCCYWGEGEWDITDYPSLEALQAEHPEMTTEVGDRERGGYWTVVDSRPVMEDLTNFKGILVFKNCTIKGGAAISPGGLISSGRFGPGTVSYQVKIDNTTYNVTRNYNDYDISLIAQ